MLTLPNLGLSAWNHTLDPYDSVQLAANFAKLDEHDHTLGKGKRITTAAIEDGAITAAKIAAGALTADWSGTLALRPAASVLGRHYYATDEGCLYYDTGSVWVEQAWAAIPAVGVSCSALSIPNNSATDVAWATEAYDQGTITGQHAPSGTVLTCQKAGIYEIGTTVRWTANTSGIREAAIYDNGGSVLAHSGYTANVLPAGFEYHNLTATKVMAVSDTVRLTVFQDSGGARLLTGKFWMTRIGS